MERLTEDKEYLNCDFKQDGISLVFNALRDFENIGTVEEFRTLKGELATTKEAVCQMCRKRGEEQHIICACVSCKYGGADAALSEGSGEDDPHVIDN